jgi:hypothetical protein
MRAHLTAIVAALLSATIQVVTVTGCVAPGTNVCDSGLACGPGQRCAEVDGRDICVSTSCADGIVQGELGEECDPLAEPVTCSSLGFYSGTVSCDPTLCLLELDCHGFCGDDSLQEGEVCEPAFFDESCLLQGYDRGGRSCDEDSCLPDDSGCATVGWNKAPLSPNRVSAFYHLGDVLFAAADGAISVKNRFGTVVEYYADREIDQLFMIDEQHGFAAAYDIVYRRDEFGWKPIATAPGPVYDIWADRDITLLSDGASIYRLVGDDWVEEILPPGIRTPLSISGRSATDVYAAGGDANNGFILHYDGAAWTLEYHLQEVNILGGRHFVDIDVSDDRIVVGGIRLHEFVPGDSEPLRFLAYGNDIFTFDTVSVHGDTVFASTSPAFSPFYDPGRLALRCNLTGTSECQSLGPFVTEKVQALGPWSAMAITGLAVQGEFDLPSELMQFDGSSRLIPSNTPTLAIAVASIHQAIFAKEDGRIIESTRRGSVTRCSSDTPDCPFGETVTDLYAPTADELFAVTGEGGAYAFADETWTVEHLDPTIEFTGIAGHGGVIVAVGANGSAGVLLRREGASWTTTPTAAPVAAVAASQAFTLAVGDGGSAYHFTGSSWETLDTNTDADLSAVVATDTVAFAAGAQGTLLRYDGTFTPLPSPTEEDIVILAGSAEDDLFLTDALGTSWHFDGISWNEVRLDARGDLYDVSVRPGAVFTAGKGGVTLIRRYVPWSQPANSEVGLCTNGVDDDADGAIDDGDNDCLP